MLIRCSPLTLTRERFLTVWGDSHACQVLIIIFPSSPWAWEHPPVHLTEPQNYHAWSTRSTQRAEMSPCMSILWILTFLPLDSNNNSNGIASCQEIQSINQSPTIVRWVTRNKLLSYTTHDSKRQPTVHPLMGLQWPDTRVGDISLTSLVRISLAVGPNDRKTQKLNGAKSKPWARQVSACLAHLASRGRRPSVRFRACTWWTYNSYWSHAQDYRSQGHIVVADMRCLVHRQYAALSSHVMCIW